MGQLAQTVAQTQQANAKGSSVQGSTLQHAAITPIHSPTLQRCSNGVECPECRQKRLEREGTLQRAAVNSAPSNGVPPIVHSVLNLPGQSLDVGTRAFIEPRFRHDFSQVPIHSSHLPVLQTKLTVNQPGDAYEQEADQVVEQVMRTAGPQIPISDNEDETKNSLMRKQTSGQGAHVATDTSSVPPIVHDVLNSGGGQPLDATTRAFMEPRFGHDFSKVRIHTDAQAAESARAVNALAYTVGRDVVFGMGQYAPRTLTGKRLLAHELAHVVQQQGPSTQALASRLGVSAPTDVAEKEAETVTSAVLNGQSCSPLQEGTAGRIARQIMQGADDLPENQGEDEKEDGIELTTNSSETFELILPAGPGGTEPKPHQKASRSPQRQGRRGRTYPITIHMTLPPIGSPDRSRKTAAISNLAGDHTGRTEGFTLLKFRLHSDIKRWVNQERTLHWVTSVVVRLADVTFKMFLTKEHKKGSCKDHALLQHEMHHVAESQQHMAQGKTALESALQGWPDERTPIRTSIISPEELGEEMKIVVAQAEWDIFYNEWLEAHAWDYVDFPRIYSQCPGGGSLEVPPMKDRKAAIGERPQLPYRELPHRVP